MGCVRPASGTLRASNARWKIGVLFTAHGAEEAAQGNAVGQRRGLADGARHKSDEVVKKRVVLDQVAPHDRIGEAAVGQLPREPMARRLAPRRFGLFTQPLGKAGVCPTRSPGVIRG